MKQRPADPRPVPCPACDLYQSAWGWRAYALKMKAERDEATAQAESTRELLYRERRSDSDCPRSLGRPDGALYWWRKGAELQVLHRSDDSPGLALEELSKAFTRAVVALDAGSREPHKSDGC